MSGASIRPCGASSGVENRILPRPAWALRETGDSIFTAPMRAISMTPCGALSNEGDPMLTGPISAASMRAGRRPSAVRQRGNVILEFAVSLGVMAALFAGAFQFGLTFFRYNLLQTALRNGAQYASMRSYDSDSARPSAEFQQAVANMVVYGETRPGAGSRPLVPGLDPDMIQVEAEFTRGVPAYVTVQVKSYDIDAVFGVHTFRGKPSVTFPYLGRFSPPVPEKLAAGGRP
jgi:hypothetical protein